MKVEEIASKIRGTVDSLGQIELSGIKLEDADAALLDINSMTLDAHVAMQPAALAYYGQLRKDAQRTLDLIKTQKDRWYKEKYADAKVACLGSSSKATVADIEARLIADNKAEIEELERKEFEAQSVADTLESWYEAWKQKGYALREHISMEIGERSNTSTSIGFDDETPFARRIPTKIIAAEPETQPFDRTPKMDMAEHIQAAPAQSNTELKGSYAKLSAMFGNKN